MVWACGEISWENNGQDAKCTDGVCDISLWAAADGRATRSNMHGNHKNWSDFARVVPWKGHWRIQGNETCGSNLHKQMRSSSTKERLSCRLGPIEHDIHGWLLIHVFSRLQVPFFSGAQFASTCRFGSSQIPVITWTLSLTNCGVPDQCRSWFVYMFVASPSLRGSISCFEKQQEHPRWFVNQLIADSLRFDSLNL